MSLDVYMSSCRMWRCVYGRVHPRIPNMDLCRGRVHVCILAGGLHTLCLYLGLAPGWCLACRKQPCFSAQAVEFGGMGSV